MPIVGTKIPVERFHVSYLNVRHGEPFGECEEDKALVHQLWLGKKIVGPFKARPEGAGYGVFVGRRRFLARKASGAKNFVVGSDAIIQDVNEREARSESLIENLKILRKEMNPVRRAEVLNEIVTASPDGLRGTARKLGLSPSTLSEWLKILELSPKMLEAVRKCLISYTEGLELAREKLSEMKQDELVEKLERDGIEVYKKLRFRVTTGRESRHKGMPKGKYVVVRIAFDKAYPEDMELLARLRELFRASRIGPHEYCKWALAQHVRQAVGSGFSL